MCSAHTWVDISDESILLPKTRSFLLSWKQPRCTAASPLLLPETCASLRLKVHRQPGRGALAEVTAGATYVNVSSSEGVLNRDVGLGTFGRMYIGLYFRCCKQMLALWCSTRPLFSIQVIWVRRWSATCRYFQV